MKNYYNHRNRSGQFYKNKKQNERAARFAIAFFLFSVIIASLYEAFTTPIIN
jgi:uncharacterized membrane protein SpoIIM required for sporulation